MILEPGNKPLMTVGSVDIMTIDSAHNQINVIVHVTCYEYEFQTSPIIEKIKLSVNSAIHYLCSEGFIRKYDGWNIGVAVVGHSSNNE
jgi:hypothetical protein